VSTCCQLLPSCDGELMKNVNRTALSNMRAWNQVSRESKTQPSRKRCVLLHCLAGRCISQAIPISAWKWSFWTLFVAAMAKLQQFVISSLSKHGSYSATVSNGCDKQVCTHGTLWCQQRILNQQPCFVKIFWTSISSATSGKILCKLVII